MISDYEKLGQRIAAQKSRISHLVFLTNYIADEEARAALERVIRAREDLLYLMEVENACFQMASAVTRPTPYSVADTAYWLSEFRRIEVERADTLAARKEGTI